MAPVLSEKDNRVYSNFLENLTDQNVKKTAFERAAKINHLVDSVTLGPNSSFSVVEPAEPSAVVSKDPEKKKISFKIKSQTQDISRVNKPSSITSDDLRALQQKFQQKLENRDLQEKVRRQLEARAKMEAESLQKIQTALEQMKLEADNRSKARKEALDRQIEAALKIEEQEEMAYQKQRIDLMMNNRKILDQQEKELKTNLKRLDDHFGKLENHFNKIAQASSPGMSQIVDVYKRQLEEVKQQKSTVSSSLDGLNRACINVEELCSALGAAIKEFNIQQQARDAQKEADDRAQKEAERIEALAKAQAAKPIVQQQPEPPTEQPTSRQSETGRYYKELMRFLDEKQTATKQLSEAKELETLRFALKMAVNTPINLLNEDNRTSLAEGFQKLHNLLSGQRIETSKGVISINDHQQANDWTKLRLAEKLIDISDKKPEATFYIAALTVALWQRFPDFGQFFIAKLFKECPFFAPYKPPQLSGQSGEEFLKSWGYRRGANGQHEKYYEFQSRTSKFAALYAAVWITQSRRDEQAPNPCGIDNGWMYLANTLNTTPDPLYLHLIDKILEIAGATLHQTFGKQFVKLMLLLRDVYLPAVQPKVDEGMKAAFDRLQTVTLASFFSKNQFEQPKGKMSPNYW